MNLIMLLGISSYNK